MIETLRPIDDVVEYGSGDGECHLPLTRTMSERVRRAAQAIGVSFTQVLAQAFDGTPKPWTPKLLMERLTEYLQDIGIY